MPARENCLANIETTLAGITSDSGYNYTVDEVLRADGPFFDYLDPSLDVMVFVEDGVATNDLETQEGIWIADLEVFVVFAVRYQPSAVNPRQRDGDLESTVRSRIWEDVIKSMLTTHTRGEYARNTFLPNDAPIIEPEIEELDGWVAHEFRFVIEHEFNESSP